MQPPIAISTNNLWFGMSWDRRGQLVRPALKARLDFQVPPVLPAPLVRPVQPDQLVLPVRLVLRVPLEPRALPAHREQLVRPVLLVRPDLPDLLGLPARPQRFPIT